MSLEQSEFRKQFSHQAPILRRTAWIAPQRFFMPLIS